MWSIPENVPCALKKKVYSAFGWNVLKISVRSISSSVEMYSMCTYSVTILFLPTLHTLKIL